MASVGLDSVKSAITSADTIPVPTSRRQVTSFAWQKSVGLAMGLMIILGFSLRLIGLGALGLAEDEINKLEAVHAYDRGDFTANAEHPVLMKVLMDVSMRAARVWNSATGRHIAEEAALRFPNVLLGTLTAIPLFLLTAALFDRRTALMAAAFWSLGINAITHNRIGKEDTLMVFFMLFAFYFFILAKQAHGSEQKQVRRLRNLSAVSFGLMMASKYFPHYLGLNMLYHHYYKIRERVPGEPRWTTPLSFFLLIGAALVVANPVILLPSIWSYLNAYSAEKLLVHTGYLMGEHLYKNTVSSSPFWGLPVYFYLLFLAIKVPLTILLAFIVGLFISVRHWRNPSYGFVLFMLFFWIVPYSLFGAKWLRYTLSLMPFVYMSAAVGVLAMTRWASVIFERFKIQRSISFVATGVLLFMFLVLPAWTAYAGAPHYALYTNALGRSYSAYFFPHDEFYDDGLNEAIGFVCNQAPRDAIIVREAPGVVRYYLEKFGRADLQVRVLSDPKFEIHDQQPSYFILQRGRTYFENQDKMKVVRARFPLVYAGCIQGRTAAEVYAAQAGIIPVVPCGDARP